MADVEIRSEIAGAVWKIVKAVGDTVEEEEPVMILESMKMEIPVMAWDAGRIREIRVAEGQAVAEGDVLAVLDV